MSETRHLGLGGISWGLQLTVPTQGTGGSYKPLGKPLGNALFLSAASPTIVYVLDT